MNTKGGDDMQPPNYEAQSRPETTSGGSRGEVLFEFEDCDVKCELMKDGTFFVNGTEHPWYKNEQGKPWIVEKRKTFKSLVKQMIREGDFK